MLTYYTQGKVGHVNGYYMKYSSLCFKVLCYQDDSGFEKLSEK